MQHEEGKMDVDREELDTMMDIDPPQQQAGKPDTATPYGSVINMKAMTGGDSFSDLLRVYYSHVFPYQPMFQWLCRTPCTPLLTPQITLPSFTEL
jgi:hypothetical protein